MTEMPLRVRRHMENAADHLRDSWERSETARKVRNMTNRVSEGWEQLGVDRRVQDVRRKAWETMDRVDRDRQQHADLRRDRMTCSSGLRNLSQTQDWTRTMSESPSGRFRVVEQKRDRTPLLTKETVRWDIACTILLIAGILFLGWLLADVATIGISSRNIGNLNSKITLLERKNDDLNMKLSFSSGDVSVCTEAVKLNLISSGGAQTFVLTAPENANLTFATDRRPAQEDLPDGRLTSMRGD